jgi:glycosyltransferase involved in cell wall biosynthesis
MPARYAAADCLVVPGRETWGLVVNEAMAAGLPAVVSDAVGCAADLIEDAATGFTYPLGEVTALAARLAAVAALRAVKEDQMRAAVRDRIARYSCAAAAEGTVRAVAALAAPDGRLPAGIMGDLRA